MGQVTSDVAGLERVKCADATARRSRPLHRGRDLCRELGATLQRGKLKGSAERKPNGEWAVGIESS
jgi:hypothetical protein